MRAALSVALAGFAAGVGAQAVQAQSYGSDNGGALDRLMQTIGVEKAPELGHQLHRAPATCCAAEPRFASAGDRRGGPGGGLAG